MRVTTGTSESQTAGGNGGSGTDARDEPATGRRRFLGRLSFVALSAAGAVAAMPIVGFIFAPVLARPRGVWRRVGTIDSFLPGQTVLIGFENAGARPWAGRAGRTGAWLRRDAEEGFVAFSVDCTHLGCPVRWEPGAELFMCPCHGGVYYRTGAVAGGPPPRPLVRYPVRLRGGHVEVRTEPLPIV